MSVARFWRETLRRYNLGASKCPDCETVFFPPRPVCPRCAVHRKSIAKMEPCQLSGHGKVYSYTIVHEAADGFEMQVPYVLAMVQMSEGPMLTGQIVDVEPSQVKEGLEVKASFRKLREEGEGGVIHYGYKFAPASQAPKAP
ncbi:MAG: Zn-ribbon domain-containing OB-fold protein [Candidatus Thermoplasmatota archaeon]|jgi:uncharacterized OB-fold protein|nr:Zn-ribbon domain-containing OB-fold protein [Candidatus Thermoplasmatota archaeon]MCL5984791.1 Zn-ribbon domain-containing OB-fold protein [Candidatus Thermoplasmatota archaeon]